MRISALAIALACNAAYAQDETYDPRSLAMGGTGVTTSNPGNAAFHNAAMLASSKDNSENDFALELPILSVRLLDENQMVATLLPQLNTNASNASTALSTFMTTPNAANATAASSALTAFSNSLSSASQKSVSGSAFLGTLLAVPNKNYAFSLYLDERAEMGGQFNYTAADKTTINNLAASLNTCAGGGACSTTGIGSGGAITGLTSNFSILGVVAKDVGIAAAHHFDNLLYGLDIGVVPKMTQFTVYDYSTGAQSGNTGTSLNQGQLDYSAFNMDMGAAKTFTMINGNQVKAGLAVKDMLSQSFTTVRGNSINVKPRATAGVSYVSKLATVGMDVDLVANQSMLTGIVKDSQFVRLGAEFDAWGWAQLRAGYRIDMSGNYSDLPSVGLGLSPFGIHVDLSVAYVSSKEGAFSLQTGFRF